MLMLSSLNSHNDQTLSTHTLTHVQGYSWPAQGTSHYKSGMVMTLTLWSSPLSLLLCEPAQRNSWRTELVVGSEYPI